MYTVNKRVGSHTCYNVLKMFFIWFIFTLFFFMIRMCILEGIYFYTIVIFILDTCCLLFLYIFSFVFFSPEWTFDWVKYLNVDWKNWTYTTWINRGLLFLHDRPQKLSAYYDIALSSKCRHNGFYAWLLL